MMKDLKELFFRLLQTECPFFELNKNEYFCENHSFISHFWLTYVQQELRETSNFAYIEYKKCIILLYIIRHNYKESANIFEYELQLTIYYLSLSSQHILFQTKN